MSVDFKDYEVTEDQQYIALPTEKEIGYISPEVLTHLKGKPFDEIALAYIHSLRPSSIRVSQGWLHSDSRCWRVTVIIDDKNIIKRITQEVEVAMPEGVSNGAAFRAAEKHGVDSEQVRWYVSDPENPIRGFIHGKEFHKQLKDGTYVLYPEGE